MKYIKISFISIFICFITAFFFMTVNNESDISYLEKRELQTFPEFTAEKLGDEEFYTQLTTAFSDQLEYRDLLVKGYYLFQFQRYNGDVVIGENDELYSAYQRVDEETYLADLENAAGYVNSVSAEINDAGAEFIFLSIPRKDAVETENLPDSYISSQNLYVKSIEVLRSSLADNVKLIDAYQVFAEDKDTRYYYTTDHHITPRAAFKLYHEILGYTEVADYEVEKYYDIEKTIVKGSFNDQIGQSVKSKPEELSMKPHERTEHVRYEDGKESSLKVFRSSNTYEDCYMEGDHAYTVIDTGRRELPNIMYVGSSFTNILEAVSVRDFNIMASIDYRDNDTGTSIAEYVRQHDIDYVIYVPSQSNDALGYWKMLEHLGL
ncbi:MAG: DHHW family protein [Anaerovoracaceae bacterium]|nr:DHHW family protein [Anaerovoracaceae bacterium]